VSDAILDIAGLHLGFRADRGLVHALRGVDLAIPRNRVVGLVGESGSGKSTVVAAAMGLLPGNASITTGHIRFDGQDLTALSETAWQALRGPRMAMVFQDPMTALNPVLPIGTQMTDVLYREPGTRAAKHDRAAAMLSDVGIPDPHACLDRFAHQLSGGMRQRVAIGMALLMQPALLIADEPTTALDVTMEAQIAHLFRQLRRGFGGSILLVSHNLGLVGQLCDDIAVIYAGQIVETGPVAQVFAAPRHPYTRLLLECDPARIPERRRELPTIPGIVADLVHVPPGCAFAPRCPLAFARCRAEAPAMPAAPVAARCHLVADAA
jgi:oligopeptide/dipeptide ABC transporter ATP-binding protein